VIEEEQAEVLPKRRGRPQKIISAEEVAFRARPKKRGRPRKVVLADDSAEGTTSQLLPKKRGRPRKILFADEATEGSPVSAMTGTSQAKPLDENKIHPDVAFVNKFMVKVREFKAAQRGEPVEIVDETKDYDPYVRGSGDLP
jgi:hypothetical protein